MEVTLYTRHDCPLCDEAKQAIRAAGLTPKEIDIDGDPDLKKRFTNDVPVIYIDGKEVFRHRVTEQQLAPYSLAAEKCLPCRGGDPPLQGPELSRLQIDLGSKWRVVSEHHLEKEFRFKDFAEALAFTNSIGAIAEKQGHHPDIYLAWGKVRVTIWTHQIDGLTRSDFVLAAKIDRVEEGGKS
ncbi:MAG TPA: 4a-hydroxytetrahydrobiopterin dehydratase [Thermoanaerobaculia bacterium]|nr:4a-hydroxytetrahydrobiopterin dehydratase [Thermoanaerobaculia bacterium]